MGINGSLGGGWMWLVTLMQHTDMTGTAESFSLSIIVSPLQPNVFLYFIIRKAQTYIFFLFERFRIID